MQDAKLVIMDEPTAALGVSQTALVLELIEHAAQPGHRRAGHLPQPQRRVLRSPTAWPCCTSATWPASGPISDYDTQSAVELITTGATAGHGRGGGRGRHHGPEG